MSATTAVRVSPLQSVGKTFRWIARFEDVGLSGLICIACCIFDRSGAPVTLRSILSAGIRSQASDARAQSDCDDRRSTEKESTTAKRVAVVPEDSNCWSA